jgi:hypothetical protein
MFKRAVITVQPDITARVPVMTAPRVTDHKANRWLNRRGRDSRAPCSRFSLPTLVRSSSSSASHRPPKNATNNNRQHPQQTTRVVISQNLRSAYFLGYVCLFVGSVISRALRLSVLCCCGFLAVKATIRVQLWFLVELDDLQTLIL